MENTENIFMILSKLAHICGYETMKKMEGFDINPGQAGILFILHHHGRLPQKELASKMHLKASSVTIALQKMEQKGFIKRQSDNRDKRIIRINITPKGEKLLIKLKVTAREMQEMVCGDMTEDELIVFRRLLLKCFNNVVTTIKK